VAPGRDPFAHGYQRHLGQEKSVLEAEWLLPLAEDGEPIHAFHEPTSR